MEKISVNPIGGYFTVGVKFKVTGRLPPLNEKVIVRTGTGRLVETLFETEFIRLHVLAKWYVSEWSIKE